ncbi:hypothetical protein AB4920_04415 [Bifidobacterium dentium]|uniref:hypothetical protein n=1 Tax=Bifidobacterium dentium TaxID=1689 RepID=UPI003D17D742
MIEIMRFIIDKHRKTYQAHVADAICGVEAISIERLGMWERAVRACPALASGPSVEPHAAEFMATPPTATEAWPPPCACAPPACRTTMCCIAQEPAPMMHGESGSYFHFLLGGWLIGKYMPLFSKDCPFVDSLRIHRF